MTVPTAVTIGNFDGVHRGHARLVRMAREAVDTVSQAGRVVVLSFEPHPLSVLRPRQAPPRLTDFNQRMRLLIEAGADRVVALEPTRQFLGQSAQDFITSMVQSHQPKVVIEGPDFRFGKGRAGTVDTLRQMGASHGFQTIVIDPVNATLSDHSTVVVSSSMIRWLIERGRMRDAARLLGRRYEIRGTVVVGAQQGRSLGIPTANVGQCEQMLPMDGIYAGTARRGEAAYPAAISVGTKPTFGQHPRVCEVHLLDYDGPLDDYGWDIRVSFDHWLRDQLAYADVQSLTSQITRDIEAVAHWARSRTLTTSEPMAGSLP